MCQGRLAVVRNLSQDSPPHGPVQPLRDKLDSKAARCGLYVDPFAMRPMIMRKVTVAVLVVFCCASLGAAAQDAPIFPKRLLKRPGFQFGDGWGTPATEAANLKKHAEARAKLAAAQARIRREPHSPDAMYELADAYYAMLWFDEAIDSYVAFARAFPNDTRYQDACYRIDACLRESRRYGEAETFLKSLPTSTPRWEIITSVRLSLLKALYKTEKDVPGALAMLEKMIAKYPNDPDIHFAREQFENLVLNCSSSPKDNAKAVLQLKWLLAHKVGPPLPNECDIGRLLMRAQDWTAAIEHYRRLLVQYPDNYPPDETHPCLKIDLATCLENVGRKDEADDLLRSVIRDYRDTASADVARSRLGEPVTFHDPDQSYRDGRVSLDGTYVEFTWPMVPMKQTPLPIYLSNASGPITRFRPVLWLKPPNGKTRGYPLKNAGGGRYIAHVDILAPGEITVELELGDTASPGKIYLPPIAVHKPAAGRISPRELRRLVELHRAVVVDVRLHPTEWVRGSTALPETKFEELWATLPKDRLIAIYDESPMEVHAAALTLRLVEKGCNAAAVYEGFDGLKKDGWTIAHEAQ